MNTRFKPLTVFAPQTPESIEMRTYCVRRRDIQQISIEHIRNSMPSILFLRPYFFLYLQHECFIEFYTQTHTQTGSRAHTQTGSRAHTGTQYSQAVECVLIVKHQASVAFLTLYSNDTHSIHRPSCAYFNVSYLLLRLHSSLMLSFFSSEFYVFR